LKGIKRGEMVHWDQGFHDEEIRASLLKIRGVDPG
jgi:hypothetical protein